MIRNRYSIHTFVFGTLLALVGMNALLFATQAANPLVASDAWSAVDTVIRKIPAGEFRITDLFIKRSANDHSQPLRKLIMVWHYKYFDLDFGIEAIVGVLFAFLNLALLWRIARPSTIEGAPISNVSMLGFTAIAGVYLSLNSSIVFSWPLLTLAYTSHAFTILFFAAAWLALENASVLRLSALFAAALLMNTVTDDVGAIATVAALIAIVVQCCRGVFIPKALWGAITIIAACALYKLTYALLVPAPIGEHAAGTGLWDSVGVLATQVPDMWKWAVIPLSASVAHRFQLHTYTATHTSAIEIGIAFIVVAAHIWFWLNVFRGRRNQPSFIAMCLMLMFYGLVAGILLARISAHGPEYLWQPRYVLIYEWNIVALLLMGIAQYQRAGKNRADPTVTLLPESGNKTGGHTIFVVAVVLLLLLQIPLSLNSWRRVRYSEAYQQRMALQIAQLANHPLRPPAKCMPQLVVCGFPVQQRVRVLRFLKTRHLNLFSRQFQLRNKLYPSVGSCPSMDSARHSSTVASTCVN